MTNAYNTAEAFLAASNFHSAEKIAMDILEGNPSDLKALLILVNLEQKRGDLKKSLTYILDGLERNPHNLIFRAKELQTYTQMKKKRRARLGLKRFKEDFPHASDYYDALALNFETAFGNDKKAYHKFEDSALSSDNTLAGIFSTLSGNLLKGQKHFLEALKNDPENYVANEHFAFNQMLLSKPLSARKAAQKVLKSNPNNFNMRFLRVIGLVALFPPIYYIHLILTAINLLNRWLPYWFILIIVFLIAPIAGEPFVWLNRQAENWFGFSHLNWLILFLLILYFSSYFLLNPKVRNLFFRKPRRIRLKDY